MYKKMVEEIQDYAIILLDKDGFIRSWNKGAKKIKFYTEEEILGKHFSIFYLQSDIDNNLPNKILREAGELGKAAHEGWRKRKGDTRFWGSIIITPLRGEDSEIIGFCKVTRDLTDKKIADDNLRMSEERYHKMIAEVQDYAIILLSVDGIIENWNTGAEKIKGYRADEVIGRKFELFYTKEDRENGLPGRLLQQAKDTGKAIQEGWRVRKDGSKFWGTIVITALHAKNGEIIGFSKVTRDLTQQKLTEEKLAAYTLELEMQNSELEQFAFVASHDLQEPLRKIQTFAELIQENYEDKEFVKRYFEKLDFSAKRMAELVKSLLNYSRLTKDRDKEDVDMNVVLSEVRQDYELLIEDKKGIIESDTLPVIKGDHIQIVQLFSNLLSNSLKFSEIKPVIRITATVVGKDEIVNAPKSLSADKYNLITFADNGIGFDEQYSKIIFSLFQRLHKKQDYDGTGIGLALCKKIVENHGGFISATCEAGQGAVFNVYLPV